MLWLAVIAVAAAEEGLFATELGAGGTSLADPVAPTAILTAPSVSALTSRYAIAVGGRLGPDRERLAQAAAMDTVTSRLGLGLVAAYRWAQPAPPLAALPGWRVAGDAASDAYRQTDLLAGIGLNVANVDRRFAGGVAVAYRMLGSNWQDPEGAVDLSASVSARPVDPVVLSVVGQDFLPDPAGRARPPKVGGGLRWMPSDSAGLEADALVSLADPASPALAFGVGGRVLAAELVPLRGGYHHDTATGADMVSAGLGIASPEASFDYAFRVAVDGAPATTGLGSWHALSLSITF